MVSASGIFHHIVGDILRDRVARLLWLTAAGLNLFAWVASRWAQSGDTFVPLHYTIYFGIDLTGPSHKLYWLPAVGTMILVIHSLGAVAMQDQVWKRTFLFLLVVLELLLILGLTAVLVWADLR